MSVHVYLKALGCRLNEAELEHWATDFQRAGYKITTQPDDAELVVINTCAVTQEAVKKSRQIIRRSQRRNPAARLVISGCYGTLNPELEQEISGIDLLIPNQDKDKLVEIISRRLAFESTQDITVKPEIPALFLLGRQKAFIKIQDGCRHRCTFCIVSVARGSERSLEVSEITDRINQLYSEGIQEVILTGVHIGGYGYGKGASLTSLLRTILEDTDTPRVRIASLEPWDLPDNLLELFYNPRLQPHLHLPLQSGCDSILRKMGRRCRTVDYTRLAMDIRRITMDFNITTDLITGFPGETDADWQAGIEYIKRTGFGHIHIFPYSPRPGTAASIFPGQVSHETRKKRCEELESLGRELKADFITSQIGKIMPVLFEQELPSAKDSGHQYSVFGYTPNFIRVKLLLEKKQELTNQIRQVKLLSYAAPSETTICELVEH
ncbi:MAG: tRNA (N(6)-L-threonylcarbamoyladenosine(37)-C(2))-methylthiotransferase MtaB [Gammaproteobacteria bacterium RIFCSPLOWO2_02_FULL_52_10]|nr:MAG: tRNA (N(6)-L-threonylcarbamoyladenosine(37)-C(2))-methylthiotransferase MtaB [Gammaproteobacteria bacterium RIFCSPLOWO2_02_FULL_52_10]